MLRKVIKWFLIVVAALIAVMTMTVACLYMSADVLEPEHRFEFAEVVRHDDSLSVYRDVNWLRKSRSGILELKVCGDAFSRGEAAGKLMEPLLYYQESVFISQIRRLVPSDSYLRFLRFFISVFNRNLAADIPEEYRNEIYGIAQSCTDEYDIIGSAYERQLNYHSAHDLGHALQDYMMVGCSSFACRDGQSRDSSLLVGRNFDFYMGDDFARNKLVMFCFPDTGHKFASVGWPGMIGVLSGMNEAGLTVTINAAKSDIPASSATPISILAREILQYASTIDEAYAIASKTETFVSESILVASAKDGEAAIIEKSPEKISVFRSGGDRIVCTNHYQSEVFADDKRNVENIRKSDSKYRFDRINELLDRSVPIGPEEAAAILRDRRGLGDTELGLGNEMAINQLLGHHSVIFRPESLTMWVSTSPWQCGSFVRYDLYDIFGKGDSASFPEPFEESSAQIPPDPCFSEKDYTDILFFRKTSRIIEEAASEGKVLDTGILDAFTDSNPDSYATYNVLGDYYKSIGHDYMAKEMWNYSLQLRIPTAYIKEEIEKKLSR